MRRGRASTPERLRNICDRSMNNESVCMCVRTPSDLSVRLYPGSLHPSQRLATARGCCVLYSSRLLITGSFTEHPGDQDLENTPRSVFFLVVKFDLLFFRSHAPKDQNQILGLRLKFEPLFKN
jgi:hypothetical protein